MKRVRSEIPFSTYRRAIYESGVMKITIDGKTVWDDDVDLTNIDDKIGDKMILDNIKRFHEVLAKDFMVARITFKTVWPDHMVVDIITAEGSEDAGGLRKRKHN